MREESEGLEAAAADHHQVLSRLPVSAAAASARQVCWNTKCGTSSSSKWRPGWLLRAGNMATLCDSCGLAYEQSRFCETFHSDDTGWRTCNSCKKRVHCGCIASVYGLVLLDKGGVECSGCARQDDVAASSSSLAGKRGQQLLATEVHACGKGVVDPAVREWRESHGTALVACQSELGPWQPPSSAAAACAPPTTAAGHHPTPWDPSLKDEQPKESQICGGLLPPKSQEQEAVAAAAMLNLEPCVNNNLDWTKAGATMAHSPNAAARDGSDGRGTESPGGHVESSSPSPKSGTEMLPSAGLLVSGVSSSPAPKEVVTGEAGAQQPAGSETAAAAGELGDYGKTAGFYRPPRVQQLLPRLTAMSGGPLAEPGFDPQAPLRVARPPGEGRGRNQLLPRYWPRITDQELQQIASGDSNTVITPLFEKMLSASDAGRIGRLVLPKACAEAYFPPIHQPEGLPLKIQDVTGKEWVFQFRFWPNNNSRMYVLEGVTPCIQSMRLQAGDTVTFSRLEADGKLVMGYRRAPSSLSSQDAGVTGAGASGNGLPCANYVAPLQMVDGWASSSKGGGGAKLKDSSSALALTTTTQLDRKRGRPLGSKSKRLRLDTDDTLLLKSSWEEAQELLRPPPSAVPTTITIDGHEFEEYSEPPVFAKKTFFNITLSGEHEQWAQCDECGNWRRLPADAFIHSRWSCSQNTWDLKRALCSAPQEVSNDKLEAILGQASGQEGGKQGGGGNARTTTMVGGGGVGDHHHLLIAAAAATTTATAAAAVGLDTLAQVAVTTTTTTSPVSPMRTTKHPRHRPGCSCIVCIQPPSGKGPKHKASCTCNVCVTVKRRFKTLMQRRKKRQFERESELARKKRGGWPPRGDDISADSAASLLLDAAASAAAAGSRPETTSRGGGGAVGEEIPTTPPVVAVSRSEDGGAAAADEAPGLGKAAIDLNSQPDRGECVVSMVRMVQDAGKPLSAYLHQQHLMILCGGGGLDPLSDNKVSKEPSSSNNNNPDEVASQTSSRGAHVADSDAQAPPQGHRQQQQQQQPQSPFVVDIAEPSSSRHHLVESWGGADLTRAGGKPPAEASGGDSVHSSSSKQDYSMLNHQQLVGGGSHTTMTPAKKYTSGAGRGRQICSGCGEPIGSAAKVCRRCGTSTAFGKKKRGAPP